MSTARGPSRGPLHRPGDVRALVQREPNAACNRRRRIGRHRCMEARRSCAASACASEFCPRRTKPFCGACGWSNVPRLAATWCGSFTAVASTRRWSEVSASRYLVEGQPIPADGARPVAETRSVSPGYFARWATKSGRSHTSQAPKILRDPSSRSYSIKRYLRISARRASGSSRRHNSIVDCFEARRSAKT